MDLNHTEVDGVPVYWTAGTGPVTAHLIFRAGVRDETFLTTGLTHLVEHLVMSGAADRRLECNANVDLTFTRFSVTGNAESVASFLSKICASVSAPPLDRLGVEKKILGAESGAVVSPPIAALLRRRFGLTSLGLADVVPPALDSLGEEEVLGLIRSHFTAGNAAVAMAGGPPAHGLALALPSGHRQPPRVPVPVGLPLPMWFEYEAPVLGLSFQVPAGTEEECEAARTVGRIVCDRAYDLLRQQHGWIYDIDFRFFQTADGAGYLCFEADPPAKHGEEVRQGLVEILKDLQGHGPTDAELAANLAELETYLADPRAGIEVASAAAEAYLMEAAVLTPSDKMDLASGVGRDMCRAVLANWHETLIVGMPEGSSPADGTLSPEQARSYPAITGREFRRGLRGALYGVPRGTRLVVGEDGVSCLGSGQDTSIRWDDVVGLELTGPGALTLIGADSLSMELQDVWFSDGRRAFQMISDRIDASKKFVPAGAADPSVPTG